MAFRAFIEISDWIDDPQTYFNFCLINRLVGFYSILPHIKEKAKLRFRIVRRKKCGHRQYELPDGTPYYHEINFVPWKSCYCMNCPKYFTERPDDKITKVWKIAVCHGISPMYILIVMIAFCWSLEMIKGS
jgi:hypothetical protein